MQLKKWIQQLIAKKVVVVANKYVKFLLCSNMKKIITNIDDLFTRLFFWFYFRNRSTRHFTTTFTDNTLIYLYSTVFFSSNFQAKKNYRTIVCLHTILRTIFVIRLDLVDLINRSNKLLSYMYHLEMKNCCFDAMFCYSFYPSLRYFFFLILTNN